MAEVLSQSQIDALLNSFASGESKANEAAILEKESKVREYDFKSPKKFTKERLRTIESLHETLTRSITTYLTSILRVYCEVSILQIEEQRYFEYSNALPDIVLMGLIDLTPKNTNYGEASIMMDMSTTVSYFMIDRLLGGSGETNDLTRDFSDIEKAILVYIMERMTRFVEESWNTYIECTATLQGIETNSRLMQSTMQEDIVVIVVLGIKIKNISGNINICIPATNLEEMSDAFGSKFTKSARKFDIVREQLRRQVLMSAITEGDLSLVALLDEFEMDVNEITHLQVGDILPLDKRVGDNVDVRVGGVPWFTAKLGRSKLKKAVMIDKFM